MNFLAKKNKETHVESQLGSNACGFGFVSVRSPNTMEQNVSQEKLRDISGYFSSGTTLLG